MVRDSGQHKLLKRFKFGVTICHINSHYRKCSQNQAYIVTYKNVRGSKAALNTLINLVCDNIIKPEEQIIDIAHADAYEDSLYIMDKIREKINIRDFINTSYDFCTGSHVGPDTIALFFIGKDRELVQS